MIYFCRSSEELKEELRQLEARISIVTKENGSLQDIEALLAEQKNEIDEMKITVKEQQDLVKVISFYNY